MGDSDDEEDLWAGLEDDDSKISVSSNLLELLGRPKEEAVVHKGDADEGRVTWVPPTHAGLANSSVVTCKTQHWNKDEPKENTPTDPVAAAAAAAAVAKAGQANVNNVAAPVIPVVPSVLEQSKALDPAQAQAQAAQAAAAQAQAHAQALAAQAAAAQATAAQAAAAAATPTGAAPLQPGQPAPMMMAAGGTVGAVAAMPGAFAATPGAAVAPAAGVAPMAAPQTAAAPAIMSGAGTSSMFSFSADGKIVW